MRNSVANCAIVGHSRSNSQHPKVFSEQPSELHLLEVSGSLAPLQKCVGGFLLYKFWRILPGIFLEEFSGHFFPQK